jgi:hypothetical protein
MEISIKNKIIIIDDSNYEKFSKYKWAITWDGYVKATNYYGEIPAYRKNTTNKIQRSLLLHRYLTNTVGTNMIDHINGNRLDNRLSNLRPIDYFGNARNRKGNSNKKLPKGVYLTGRSNKKYRVRVQTKLGYTLEGGSFECVAAAALKYNELSRSLFGEHHRNSI